MISRNRISPSASRAVAWLASLISGVAMAANVVSEPETLIYGRILNRENPNVQQILTSGELHWSILKPDGTTLQLTGQVSSYDQGQYSYLLRIPHQAMMLGQQVTADMLQLGTVRATATHGSITFNGAKASILAPATSVFDLDQVLRASALRVDLEITAPNSDLDGDGMPDWWEDANGLDKQNASDALTDRNGNGVNNLAEFLAGTDPNLDSTQPRLVTSEVIAYSESKSIVLLETQDTDSTPAQLIYTLRSTPSEGTLKLRNVTTSGDRAQTLAAGSTFTQADVLAGRLIYEHAAGQTPGSFEVSVRDQTPTHVEASGDVAVLLFAPNEMISPTSAAECVRLEAKRLAKSNGYLVADLGAAVGPHRLSVPTSGMSSSAYQTFSSSWGTERPHVLIGGPSDDTLSGGAANDFLYGSDGSNTLTGDAGADTFIFTGDSPDADTVTDFNPAQGDVIDLSGVMNGTSKRLTDYARIRRSGLNAVLEISSRGTASGYTDRVIVLQNSSLQPTDLLNLYYLGSLQVGEIGMPPRVSIVATTAAASENGPTAGMFTVSREGDLAESLVVSLMISGNATNGIDYQMVSPSVTIPAGAASVTINILPYVDATTELTEEVFFEIAGSATYLIGTASAKVTIEELKPQISLEVLEGIAGVSDGTPGAVLVRRSGLLTPEVFVQFSLSGTATNGTHYHSVNKYLTFSSGQSSKVVEFVPKSAVNFNGAEARTIRMTIQPDSTFATMKGTANLVIVPKRLTYDEWLASSGKASSSAALMHYGFATAPTEVFDPANNQRLPKAGLEAGYLTLRFRRKPGVTDLDYIVEYSEDLVHWNSGPNVVEDITSQASPSDPAAAVYRAKKPMTGSKTGMMRVRLLSPDGAN